MDLTPHAGRSPIRFVCAVAAALTAAAAYGLSARPVTLEPVAASRLWPDAAEAGALRLACAGTDDELRAFFEQEGAPFRATLVRRETTRSCHVFYRPSHPGFRASPDDDVLAGLVFDTDPLAYLVAGPSRRTDPAAVMRKILQRIARPLDVTIQLHFAHDRAAYEAATRRLIGSAPHRVRLVDRGASRTFWWVQDWFKAGASRGGATALLPRRIYEGRRETAAGFDPMLDRFAREERAARSRLSWEGGDLQFTRDPRTPERLVLYHGHAAKPYWGDTLTALEYGYVLEREFGADQAVDLGGLAPHVDYFVSFLPQARTALVGVPVSGDLEVARAAVDALASRFAGTPPAALVELREALAAPSGDGHRAREALDRAREQQPRWSLAVDGTLPERMRALVKRVCPDGADCLSPARQLRLLEADPVTFADWVHATQSARDEGAVIAAHLDVVESQLDPVPGPIDDLALRKIAELEQSGFRVLRIPAFRVDLVRSRPWPGISYVNALVVDRQVFVPRFGLGAAEDRLLRDASARLPAGYELVPIDAQDVMVRNGGLHCLAGLVR